MRAAVIANRNNATSTLKRIIRGFLKRDILAKINYPNKEKSASLLCYERVDVSNVIPKLLKLDSE